MSDRERPAPSDDAVLDLLIREIAGELSPEELRMLDSDGNAATAAQRRELEGAVGAVALAASFAADGHAPRALPAGLKERILRDADRFFGTSADVVPLEARRAASRPQATAVDERAAAAPSLPSYSAWWVAAACLLVGAFGWLRTPPSVVPAGQATLTPASARPPTLAEQRRALLAGRSAVTLPLGATPDPVGARVSGDVVWDAAAQRGFIRFVGLPPNDPGERQYQIWIFDAARDQRYPVDGGVFDIPAGQSEVVVPIHAKIAVFAATAFAVTLEKAGGVVVSSRDRVVALAKST